MAIDGSFDYAYARAWQFADELAERLDAGVDYSPETVAVLRQIVDVARHAGSLMREAEWLFTGWSDETELKRRTVDRRLQAIPRPQARAALGGILEGLG